MAEKSPELETREDKINKAKEHYARGYRNYVVGDFNEAAEDLSHSCELYAELFGDESEEVAIPNLFYGKTLIELAQMGENKVLVLPDKEEDDEDEDDEEGGANGANADDDDDSDSDGEESNIPKVNAGPELAAGSSSTSAGAGSSSDDPQPGTSSGITNGNSAAAPTDGEAEVNENLQFAWEALEMCAKVFRRLGVGYEEYLAEAHYGLGEILMENQNCPEAVRDYNIAFEIFRTQNPEKTRNLAEIKYKTGLCHYTSMAYDKSIVDFQLSADYIQQAIDAKKKEESTPAIQQTIEDLANMREDIINKIAEVEETKQMLRASFISKGGYGALLSEDVKQDGAGFSSSSSSSQAEKPKATDISHLIKRKKPDTATEPATNSDVPSPAKKPAI